MPPKHTHLHGRSDRSLDLPLLLVLILSPSQPHVIVITTCTTIDQVQRGRIRQRALYS
jgi:hypothetical protein